MKARVKATGDILDIASYATIPVEYCDSYGNPLSFSFDEVEILSEKIESNVPDYWTRLEHQAAIGAMQGMIRRAYEAYCDDCANYDNMIFEDAQALLKDHAEALADVCVEYSHSLIQKLKEKEERK